MSSHPSFDASASVRARLRDLQQRASRSAEHQEIRVLSPDVAQTLKRRALRSFANRPAADEAPGSVSRKAWRWFSRP